MSEQHTEFNTGLPSIRRIQKLIQGKQTVSLLLSHGDPVQGVIRWQDPLYLCVAISEQEDLLINRAAIIWLRVEN
ncbi:MAG: RNA-binding protein hfq [Thermostichales cyanobacterium DRC_bins_46]